VDLTAQHTGGGIRAMARRLVLFDVDGVLVEKGELRRLPGAAEALAQLRHGTDAVLSLVTGQDEEEARRKTTSVGVERYLDFVVGAYGSDIEGRAKLVSLARRRAEHAYGCEFEALVVVGAAADLAYVRADAHVVVVVAPPGSAQVGPLGAGADHIVTNLLELVPLVRTDHGD
jgi:phosphoglycolate phosphatase-like HAD superfamily hydrolase